MVDVIDQKISKGLNLSQQELDFIKDRNYPSYMKRCDRSWLKQWTGKSKYYRYIVTKTAIEILK